MEATVLMALLQPAPETFELFDDLILLSDGHIVYQGPREHVVEFFESLSFKLPPRKGVADFLQEVFLEYSFLLSLMVIGKMVFEVIFLTWYFHIPGNI
jgi:ABC-type multidrug transport system ATPase subunit